MKEYKVELYNISRGTVYKSIPAESSFEADEIFNKLIDLPSVKAKCNGVRVIPLEPKLQQHDTGQ